VRASGPLAIGAGTSIAGAFNAALAARLSGEKGVSMFDLFATLDDIVHDKQAYGLVNVTDASGNPNAGIDPATALFWDGIHPTAAGHKVLARAVLQLWPDLLRECDDPRGYHGHDRDGRGHEDRDWR
jgi:outer membrane lipase/esterase